MSSMIIAITISVNDTLGYSLTKDIDHSRIFESGLYSDLPFDYSNLDEAMNSTKDLDNLDVSENKLEEEEEAVETSSDHIQANEQLDKKTTEKLGINSPLTDSANLPPYLNEKKDELEGLQMKLEGTKSDHGELPPLNSETNDHRIAIINFDDNWKSQYQYAKPILDKYQFKASFYVVCDYMDKKNRLSWDELKNLYREGHEIGSHTMSHANLDNVLTDGADNEIVQSKKCIEDRGIKVTSFSYPFNSGDDNLEILDLVSSNYEFARTAGGDPGSKISSENDESFEQYSIIGWSHDAERKKHIYSDLEMLQKFKEYVKEYSKEDGKSSHIPIIIYHKIGDINDEYSTSIDLFESEMNYLNENGFKVITMAQVFGKS